MQIIPGDAGYVGADNSGVFVFGAPPTGLAVGSRIDLNPTQVTNFHGEIELTGGTPIVKNPGAPEMPGAGAGRGHARPRSPPAGRARRRSRACSCRSPT